MSMKFYLQYFPLIKIQSIGRIQVDITISKNQGLQILYLVYSETYVPQLSPVRETRKLTVETISK